MRWESFKFWDLVRLILESLRCISCVSSPGHFLDLEWLTLSFFNSNNSWWGHIRHPQQCDIVSGDHSTFSLHLVTPYMPPTMAALTDQPSAHREVNAQSWLVNWHHMVSTHQPALCITITTVVHGRWHPPLPHSSSSLPPYLAPCGKWQSVGSPARPPGWSSASLDVAQMGCWAWDWSLAPRTHSGHEGLRSMKKVRLLTLYMLNSSEGPKTYIHFMTFLHINMTQVVEIPPQVRQCLKTRTYLFYIVKSWVLIPWWHKEPGHQQPWYWLC